MEGFKDIKGYEGEYQVNKVGDVYSLPRRGHKFVCKGRIRKPQKHPQGYLFVNLRRNEQWLIHRLVAMTFLPNPENKEFVNHINGDKRDNRVENLEWVTRQENETHAYSTGLKNSTGSNNTMAKLTEDCVIKIKKMASGGSSLKELSEAFNVHRVTIGRIINGRIWKHVA